MVKPGTEQFKKELKESCQELREKGYKVIELNGKSPDAIAVKGDQIIAVEVIGKYKVERNDNDHRRYRWKFTGGTSLSQKRSTYSMFDDVYFFFFRREES